MPSSDRGERGGRTVQLAGGIGKRLFKPVARRLGLLLAGAVAWRGGPQEIGAQRGVGAEPGRI